MDPMRLECQATWAKATKIAVIVADRPPLPACWPGLSHTACAPAKGQQESPCTMLACSATRGPAAQMPCSTAAEHRPHMP